MTDTTNTSYDFLDAPVVDGGYINEQGVMNVALSFFDRNRDIVEDANEKEVILFKQIMPLSMMFCASRSDWSFLTETAEYETDDIHNDEPVPADEYEDMKGWVRGPEYDTASGRYIHRYRMYKNFAFAYKLPSDFIKVRYIDGDVRIGYAVKGNVLYCNEYGCSIDYISSKYNNLPVDFGYMVAYKSAMELAMYLDPEGTALTRASAMLEQTFAVLKQRDDTSYRLQNPAQNHYVDKKTSYWNFGGYKL